MQAAGDAPVVQTEAPTFLGRNARHEPTAAAPRETDPGKPVREGVPRRQMLREGRSGEGRFGVVLVSVGPTGAARVAANLCGTVRSALASGVRRQQGRDQARVGRHPTAAGRLPRGRALAAEGV